MVYQQGADTAKELIEKFNSKVDYRYRDIIFIDKTTTNIIVKARTVDSTGNRNLDRYLMLRGQDVRRISMPYDSVIELELYDNETPYVLVVFACKMPLLVLIIFIPFTFGAILLFYPFLNISDRGQAHHYYRRISNIWNFG